MVERPASVVKELIENALDAGARSVQVEIEGGGKSLVRVRDDGCGMDREDARTALERHATSKLRSLADLEGVATHGFRGEALPSIASVSHLVLQTRAEGEPAGTEVEVRHGRVVHVKDAGHPRGTTVEVRDLFGAVPARRKFLRADATESGHVAEAVTLLALARPDVGFSLSSSGRALLQAPPTDGLAARVYQVFGSGFLDDLAAVEGERGWVQVRGLASRTDRPPAGRGTLRLFVNGRAVRDRAIARAVTEAYRAAGVREPRSDVVLFVDVPLHLVDVNVHPAKTEVRFAEARAVWSAVEGAVREALARGAQAAVRRAAVRAEGAPPSAPASLDRRTTPPAWAYAFEPPGPSSAGLAVAESPAALPVGTPPPAVLGQHRNTYIVASDGEDLFVIDQHTAHERVRFETLVDALEQGRPAAQRLLSPVVVTLPPRLRPGLAESQETLSALGFEVDPFGGDAVRVSSVPEALGTRDPGRALLALLAELVDRQSADWLVSSARDRVAATLACHSAARGGDPLSAEAMRSIVAGLWRARDPAVCPHGRPTRVRVPKDDVSRWFRRTGWRRD